MKKRNEKSFHIRLNLDKATDRDIYEWLRGKEEGQTISINAFVIEGLRKLKIAEMRSEETGGTMPVTEPMQRPGREASPEKQAVSTDSGGEETGAAETALSAEAMSFLDEF